MLLHGVLGVRDMEVRPSRHRIHTADCLFCADGRGFRAGSDSANGKWHGPFETFALVDAASSELRGPTYCCVICRPDLR